MNLWIRRIGLCLLLAGIAVFLVPSSAQILGPILGAAAWTGAAFGYLSIFIGIPFLLSIVARVVYKIFLRPYVRARHIRAITERRLLREAAERDGSAQL
jgi:hypothetical protein